MTLLHEQDLEEPLVQIARRAGDAIMKIYESGDFQVERKGDDSPLTAADTAANAVIVDGLRALAPSVPVLSEEMKQAPFADRKDWGTLFVVDPLDGTKEFIKRNGEFTVNVALVVDGITRVGVVHAPALDLTYYGHRPLGTAVRYVNGTREPIMCAPHDESQPIRVVASRSHRNRETEAFLAALPEHELVSKGSSLKLCLLAEGAADVYPRLAPTMEWDTAAAHAVLRAAGGVIHTPTGGPLRYNKENLLNPFFVAAADQEWLNPFLSTHTFTDAEGASEE